MENQKIRTSSKIMKVIAMTILLSWVLSIFPQEVGNNRKKVLIEHLLFYFVVFVCLSLPTLTLLIFVATYLYFWSGGTVLYTVRSLIASLASIYQMQLAPHSLSVTIKSISSHCWMSPGRQSHRQLKILVYSFPMVFPSDTKWWI